MALQDTEIMEIANAAVDDDGPRAAIRFYRLIEWLGEEGALEYARMRRTEVVTQRVTELQEQLRLLQEVAP